MSVVSVFIILAMLKQCSKEYNRAIYASSYIDLR